jgi:FKBP-type peptidyl-prolyl cis-trans isomerases 1
MGDFVMTRFFRQAAIATCMLTLTACSQAGTGAHSGKKAELKTDPQKFSYSIGYELGKSMQKVKKDVDIGALEAGIEQGVAGAKPQLDKKERDAAKMAMLTKIRAETMKQQQASAKGNAAASAAFMAKMAKEPGVKTTADGLEYKVDKEGTGASPKPDDMVSVNYTGKLPDGTVFDSSAMHGDKPATFRLGDVIQGWVEGLQLMKEGAKYTFYIPPKLAYGERGAGGKIGPEQALVFDVELVKVGSAKGDASASGK